VGVVTASPGNDAFEREAVRLLLENRVTVDQLVEALRIVLAPHQRHLKAKRAHAPVLPADTAGHDLKPDPLAARTPAELVDALRSYRVWAGEPSFRDMANQAGQVVAASTLCTALKNDGLPPLKVVVAIVTGCGGSTEDQERFATAWRRLRLGISGDRPLLQIVPPQTVEG
jgi:hypothetical protein